jgi:YidC/Oxa1 family membrane protein insertase
MIGNIYDALLYQPLLNALVFLYNTIAFQDLGLAIIFLTIIIRLILFPVFQKSTRYQLIMQEIQPKLKKLQEEHKKDLQKQTEAMMALYKEHRVNPFSGIGFLFLQLPILIALYQIFLNIFTEGVFANLYSFVARPEVLHGTFLGLLNLAKSNMVVVGFAALLQYLQMHMSFPKKAPGEALSPEEKMGRRMAIIGPILTIVIFYRLPAAIGLYWAVTSLFSIVQQYIITEQLHKEKNEGLERIRQ